MAPDLLRYLLGLGALGLDAYLLHRIAVRLGPDEGVVCHPVDRILGRVVVALAVGTLTFQILGVAGRLDPVSVLVTHGVLAGVLGLTGRGRKRANDFLSVPLLEERESRWIATALAVPYGFLVFYMLVRPPWAWDSLSYHLPMAVEWLQAGELNDYLVLPFRQRFASYFPSNGELLSLWLLLWTGDDSFANVLNFLVVPFLFLAIVRLGRQLRLSEVAVAAGGALFLLAPGVVRSQIGTANVDLYATFLIVAGLGWTLSIARGEGTRRSLWLAAVAFGLSVGVKYNFLAYAGLSTLLLAACLAFRGGDRFGSSRARRAALAIGAVVLAVLVLAGYWYVRNAVRTGNPLYPLAVSVGERSILPGFQERVDSSIVAQLRLDPGLVAQFLHEIRIALGVGFFLLLPACFFAPLVELMRRGREKAGRGAALALYLAPIPLTVLYTVTPNTAIDPLFEGWRFNLIGHLLAWLCVVRVVSALSLPSTVVSAGCLALIVSEVLDLSYPFAAPPPWRYLGVAIVVAIVAWREGVARAHFVGRAAYVGAALAVLVGAHHLRFESARRVDIFYRDDHDGSLQSAIRFIEGHTPTTVAVAGWSRTLPVYGGRFQHRVIYLPIDRGGSSMPHQSSGGDPRSESDRAAWLERVETSPADYLLAGVFEPGEPWPVEERWAAADPDRFERIVESPSIRIYRIVR